MYRPCVLPRYLGVPVYQISEVSNYIKVKNKSKSYFIVYDNALFLFINDKPLSFVSGLKSYKVKETDVYALLKLLSHYEEESPKLSCSYLKHVQVYVYLKTLSLIEERKRNRNSFS